MDSRAIGFVVSNVYQDEDDEQSDEDNTNKQALALGGASALLARMLPLETCLAC